MNTFHTEKYYACTGHILDVFDAESRKMGLNANNIQEYYVWKKNLREKLTAITGLNRMEKCELYPKVLETVRLDGYMRQKMIIQTETNIWMTFYVLVPDDIKKGEKRPSMIAPHGHVSGGKLSTAGRIDIPAIRKQIDIYHYDYGVRFVKEGFISFCPDARAFGERREWMGQGDNEDSFLNSTCTPLNHIAISLGRSLTGMWTWDLMRLVDYIQSREDCDADKIGCGGLSGGGLQTLWVSAMDDRIKCAVVSGYFYGYKDSLLKLSNNCGCNYVPHLWENADMGDLGALIAPRPLLVETGDMDPLNGERGLSNVLEQLDITRKAYKLLNVEDKLYHHVFKGEHMWNGEKTYGFIKQHLK